MPRSSLKKATAPSIDTSFEEDLNLSIDRASSLILSQQAPEGYWWYTLEANESINAEFIFLMNYLDCVDLLTQNSIANRLLSSQNLDGSWSVYHQGEGDISLTIEGYLALKLAKIPSDDKAMRRARDFILMQGGITKCRIFTRIHLALFGLIPFSACPMMPVSLIQSPPWAPIHIYEFSSWARATVVPLLVVMDQKKIRRLPSDFLDALYLEKPSAADWSFKTRKSPLSWDHFFIQLDQCLRAFDRFAIKLFQESSLKKCESWIREHIQKTEDIYPALAYGAMALHSLGYPLHDPDIQKCLSALRKFQMPVSDTLPPLPLQVTNHRTQYTTLYQQCCISPVWDTPWAGVSLLEAGVPPDHPQMIKSGEWLVLKQILDVYGDWAIKNKKAKPGGWSFEFENDYFPDVDDTIEVLFFLNRVDFSMAQKRKSIGRGLDWFLSMQCKNGGWAAFDVDNTLEWVNKIPFSDHGACLDPATPDITGRAIELLVDYGYTLLNPVVKKAIHFLESTQEPWGPWWGRWGVNYIYGTWCVLGGLTKIGYPQKTPRFQKAIHWLLSIQRPDGGFGESCESYARKKFIPLDESVPSQTAWALMALVSAGLANTFAAKLAAEFLMNSQNLDGSWDEEYHTGTGFPGHFYIRYHGYRHYFPLLALSRFKKAI